LRYQYASTQEPETYVPPHNETPGPIEFETEQPGPTTAEPEPSITPQPEAGSTEPEPSPTQSPTPESGESAPPTQNEDQQILDAPETAVPVLEILPEPEAQPNESESEPRVISPASPEVSSSAQIYSEPELPQALEPLPQANPEPTQAAQSMLAQPKSAQPDVDQSPLFIGLLAVGIFALLAGLFVVRRGVHGAIAN
jgi:hypothetical protein